MSALTAMVLVVLVPEADPIIGDLRAAHTPGGRRGMPSHITLLSPFLDDVRFGDAAVSGLRDALTLAPFDFALTRVERFNTGVLYLAVEPVEPFRELISRVCDAFPGCAPYGGEFAPEEVIPHCTIAVSGSFPHGLSQGDAERFARVEADVTPAIPIACRAATVALMVDEADGWSVRETLNFAP